MFEQTMNFSVLKGIAIAQMQWMWYGESNTLQIYVTKVNGVEVNTCTSNYFAWKCEETARKSLGNEQLVLNQYWMFLKIFHEKK